jgi:hypothetical protein
MIASGPVIPVFSRRLSMAAECGFCAVFKDRGEAVHRPALGMCGGDLYIATAPDAGRAPVSQSSTACWRV